MKRKFRFSVFSFWSYLVIFFSICVIVTVAINLFIFGLDIDMNIEKIKFRAKITFASIFLMAAVFTLVLGLGRKFHAEKPVRMILEETSKIRRGDLSARLSERENPLFYNEFDEIIKNLNVMAGELSGLETLRLDFISNVSHELKTPLSAMQNYATILQSPGLDEKTRLEYAMAVSSNCRRLTALITNILKLNKLENQKIYPKSAPYDLGEQLRECVLAFEDAWEAKNIDLEADIADGITSTSDPELLSLVWNNLLSNAVKFTSENGKITVSASEEKDSKTGERCAVVKVSDTGCGMDEKTLAHIFEKFYQGDTSHATQGNGLGLALAARVANISVGKILVQSEKGKGSIFTFILPL